LQAGNTYQIVDELWTLAMNALPTYGPHAQLAVLSCDNTATFETILDVYTDFSFILKNLQLVQTSLPCIVLVPQKHCMFVTDAGRVYTWGRDTVEGEATGLGYNTNGETRWRPTELLNSQYFACNRVGCWHHVSATRALSFAMTRHPRLSTDSPARDFLQGPMQDMMSTMGPHAQQGGLGRLLGRKTRR